MSTTHKGLTIPEQTDVADANAAFEALVASGPIPRFADAAARNAALTSPEDGTLAYEIDDDAFSIRRGTSWDPPTPRIYEARQWYDNDDFLEVPDANVATTTWVDYGGFIGEQIFSPRQTLSVVSEALVVVSCRSATVLDAGGEVRISVSIDGTVRDDAIDAVYRAVSVNRDAPMLGFAYFTGLSGFTDFRFVARCSYAGDTATIRSPAIQVIIP